MVNSGRSLVQEDTDTREIQGNVLQPFDGHHQAFVFLSFGGKRAEARAWLGAAADRVARTADVSADQAAVGIAAARSLMSLGLTAAGMVTLHPEVADILVTFEAFWKGPLGNRIDERGRITSTPAMLGDVGDSDPTSWLIGGARRAPVEALLTIAADDEDTLRERVGREQREATSAGLTVMPLSEAGDTGPLEQYGNLVFNAAGQPIEHFGFVDGISHPRVRGFDDGAAGSPAIAAGEFVLGLASERRPQDLGPRPTPAAWMRGGSFQVFRRLRQDVAGWWSKMDRLSGPDDSPEELAAKAMGRRLDGTPLAPDAKPDDLNDFTYEGDEDGVHTPLYSHIRKMNPRNHEVFRDRGHKLLRRGIPFGPLMDRRNPDDHERGMLFNAYMASIEDQFEFLQRCWANDPEFPSSTVAKFHRHGAATDRVDGLDPVIGYGADVAHRRHGDKVTQGVPPLAFGGLVTTTGAVYAFVPPRASLYLLAGEAPLTSVR